MNQRALLNFEKTATGPLADAFAEKLFIFRFVFNWSTNRHQTDFLEQQRHAMRKWDKKRGKQSAPAEPSRQQPPSSHIPHPTHPVLPPSSADVAINVLPSGQNDRLLAVPPSAAAPAGHDNPDNDKGNNQNVTKFQDIEEYNSEEERRRIEKRKGKMRADTQPIPRFQPTPFADH